jgi:alpha-L-fucosidase
MDRLKGMGQWMRRHGRSIYGCTQAPEEFRVPENCAYTYNPQTNRLYLHVLSWPFKHIHLEGMADRVAYAQLLHDASEVKRLAHVREEEFGGMKAAERKNLLTLEVPVKKPAVTVPVVEIFLK